MRISTLFSQTRRKSKDHPESISNELLVRAGYVRQLASGIYSYLPLAVRVMRKIEKILREEIEAIGGQEILMPVINPADIWKESGRWHEIDAEMGRFTDRTGRDMVLAMTHEEVISDLVRNEVHSYRHLPSTLYHIQTKWRDDPRPRAGLLRVREFTMKDSYSLDLDEAGMRRQYEDHYRAYFSIFSRCSLPVSAVSSDLGMMGGARSDARSGARSGARGNARGGQRAHEYMYRSESGEDTILHCESCGYAANRQIATSLKTHTPITDEKLLPIERVHTPGASTIESLAEFLEMPKQKLAKAVFLIASLAPVTEPSCGAGGEGPGTQDHSIATGGITNSSAIDKHELFVLALIRGDLEVNETKLANAVGAISLRAATEDEIRDHSIEPGFGSPIGAKQTLVVVDDTIQTGVNFVAGANEHDYHYININHPRDFTAEVVADIASAEENMTCSVCDGRLSSYRGVEVGNIFQLGTKYSDSMNCTYLDGNGERKPIFMGSYGIGVGRLMACIVEEYHDRHGLIWPPAVAPFDIHIINLCRAPDRADEFYSQLKSFGLDVLYDDRSERAGIKFNDADLIGIPVRLTVGERSLESGSAEVKLRWESDSRMVSLESVIETINMIVAKLPVRFAECFQVK